MKLKLFLVTLLISAVSWGQVAAWDFTGLGSTSLPTATATVFNTNMDSSNSITRGATAGWSTAGNSFRTTGFQNNGIATTNTDYFQITLSASTGYTLSLSTIDAKFAGTATFAVSPGVSSQFAYSLDGTTFTLISSVQVTIGSTGTLTQINLSGISALQNVPDTTTVTLRYYASGQTTTGGWGFNSPSAGTYGLAIGGSCTSVASPPVVTASTFTGNVGSSFSNSISATNSPTSYALANSTTLPAGLSLNTTTGLISGIPSASGTFTTDVTATNAAGTSAIVTLTFNISAISPPVVTGASLTAPTGSAYTYTISATNSPTSYTLASGTLPTGLSLNTSTGVISGTPTATGSYSVTVTATNAGGTSSPATINFTITVPAPVVTGSTQSGTVGTAFTYTISATNSPTSYAQTGGTLPGGLSLNTSTGVISGTPTTVGSYSITVTATNAGGTSSAATINFTIVAAACVTQGFSGGTTAPSGWVFASISSTYTSAGNYGAASPSLSMNTNSVITTEVLPAGNGASQLSFWFKGQGISSGSSSTLQVDGFDGVTWTNIEIINSATLIASTSTAVTRTYNSGSTPALTSGYVRFRFTYLKGTGNLALDDVIINCTPITINVPVVTGSSEIGTVGSAYSYTVNASNFPTSYAIVAGSLPPGLSFSTITGQISGAPTTAGSYSVDVTATNSGGTSASATISFTISAYTGGCYSVNFEDGSSKTAYVADNVTLNGKLWNLSETLDGNLVGDFGTSTYALRMRSNNYSAATMVQDKANGIGTISFDYKKYGSDSYTNQLFNVEYSKDGGNTWIYIGSVAPSTTTITTFSATVNQSGPIRVRIIFISGTETPNVRLNIDNLSVCDYVVATKDIELYGNSTTILNNSTTVSINNNTNFSSAYFVGDAPIVKTFVIKNNGTGTLSLSSLAISSSPYFSITSGLSSTTLTIGQSATFTVSFSSTITGLESATLTILSDDPLDGTFNFLVSARVYNYIRCTLLPLSYIAQQDFDSNVGYTYTAGASNSNTSVAGNTDYGNNRVTKSNMFTGTNSFQSYNSNNNITFATINTQGYQNIEMDFSLGAYATSTSDGMETSDYVMVSMSIDGGVTYYNQLQVTGNNNSIFDINNTLTTNTAVYKANSTNPSRIGTLNNSANTLASSFKITNLPSVPDLRIKIEFLSNSAAEIWAIDNIAVRGQLPLTTTWDGTTWSAGAPASNTKAIFNGFYDTTTNGASVQACECQLNVPNTVNVTTGNYLEVQSNLTNNGVINVSDGASLIQYNDDAVNSGTGYVNVIRTTSPFKKFDYTYWSSPIQSATISSTFSGWRTDYSFGFATANYSDTLTINSAGAVTASTPDSFDDYAPWAWQAYTGAMTAGQGYAIMGPTNLSFSPTATTSVVFTGQQNNGLITLPLALSGNSANTNDDFNLIGNPYPSAIFGDTFINLNPNMSGTLYFWTHGTAVATSNPGPDLYNFISDDYAMYNLSGGTASATGSTQPTGYVASGEGFFVEAITATNVLFNDSMRSKNYSNSNFYKNSVTSSQQSNEGARSRVWLNLQNPEGMFSQQLIAYSSNSTLGFDRGYDGLVNASNNYVSFYSFIASDYYRIQARSAFDENDVVPLGFFTASSGNYTISLDSFDGVFNNQDIYLKDLLLDIVYDLKQGPYVFHSDYGTYNNRFQLKYTNSSLTTSAFEGIDSNVVVATPTTNQIAIKSALEKINAVEVYDLLGRVIVSKSNVSENVVTFTNITARNQVLLVKIHLENGQTVTRKVFL